MKNLETILLISILSLTTILSASSIRRMSLSELEKTSDLVVMGQVTDVQKKGNIDQVSIKIGPVLKGVCSQATCTFPLTSRGGLKDFDPALKVGDTGVFFLKKKGDKVVKAYWGSIAIFPKKNFVVADRSGGLPVSRSKKETFDDSIDYTEKTGFLWGISEVRINKDNSVTLVDAESGNGRGLMMSLSEVVKSKTIKVGETCMLTDGDHATISFKLDKVGNDGKITFSVTDRFDARSFGDGIKEKTKTLTIAPYKKK